MALHEPADPDDLMTASDAGHIIGVPAMAPRLGRVGKLADRRTTRGVRVLRRADVGALATRRASKKRSATESTR
jgi:hypothetical protein